MLALLVTNSSLWLVEELERVPLAKYTVLIQINGKICLNSRRSVIIIALVPLKVNKFSCFVVFTMIHDNTLILLSVWMWVCQIKILQPAGKLLIWTRVQFKASLRQDRVSALAKLTKMVFWLSVATPASTLKILSTLTSQRRTLHAPNHNYQSWPSHLQYQPSQMSPEVLDSQLIGALSNCLNMRITNGLTSTPSASPENKCFLNQISST